MKLQMNKILNASLAKSTNSSYRQKVKKYKAFCKTHKLKPLLETNVCYFVTSLAQTASYATILTYVAAIKNFIKQHKPVKYVKRMYSLKRLLLGLKRLCKPKHKNTRLPISHKQLKIIKSALKKLASHHNRAMLWCAITFAFFGLLRVSEMVSKTQSSFDKEKTLLYNDVKICKQHVKIHLKSSKTDQYSSGADVVLAKNKTALCPHRAALKYADHVLSRKGPFFTYENGKFLTNRSFNKFIRSILPSTNAGSYSSHSLRIGAATEAARRGYPKYVIQQIGRWRSSSFKKYIKFNKSTYIDISKSLAPNT